MADKTATLRLQLVDQLSGKAKRAAEAILGVGKAADAAGRKRTNLFGIDPSALRSMRTTMAFQSRMTRQRTAEEAAAGRSAEASRRRLIALEREMTGVVQQRARLMQQAAAAQQRAAAQAAAAQRRIRDERRVIVGGMAAGAGLYTAHRTKGFARDSILQYGEYDYAVRRQRAFADMSPQEQARILLPQSRRIATDTKFSNQDVIEAQTEVARRLPAQLQRAHVIAPIIGEVKNYALATKGVDMNQSAEAVTGYLMSAGKDISTAAKSAAEANRATNLLIRMQKIGGLGHEDLQHFVTRGVSAGRIAGLSEATMGAFVVGLRRNNISGDQAGTAMRTVSAKLVAPTEKARAALATAGINYDDYTTMPGGLSVKSLEGKFQQDFGKKFTPAIRKRISAILEDEDIVSDRGEFTTAVTAAVAPLFRKTKKGEMAAADRRELAKKIGQFHRFSVESVDAERLLLDIIGNDSSLAVLNAFATDKHGNKLGLIGKSFEQFLRDRADLQKVPSDYGEKIAAEITGGFGGALERLRGSVENLAIQMSQANEGWLTPAMDKLGNAIDAIADLPEGVRMALTAAGGAAALFGGVAGLAGLVKLTLAGPALLKSAGALNIAALRLAAGGALAGAGSAVGAGAAAGAAGAAGGSRFTTAVTPRVMSPAELARARAGINAPAAGGSVMSRIGAGVKGGLITTAVYAGGVYAIGKLLDSLPKPAYPPGYDPEAEFNKSTFDRIKEIVGLKERDPLLPPKTDGVPVQDRVSSAWDASPVSSAPVLLDPSPDLKDTARLPPQRPKALAPDRPTPLQPERPADFSQGTSQIPRHDVGRIDEVFAQAKMSDPGQLAGAMDAAMKQMQTSIQTGFAQALAEADRFMAQMNAKLSQTLAPTIRPRVDMSGIRGIHADTGVE